MSDQLIGLLIASRAAAAADWGLQTPGVSRWRSRLACNPPALTRPCSARRLRSLSNRRDGKSVLPCHCSCTATRSPDVAVFDFRIDPVEPLLCALRSIPVPLDFSL
jgi:hypothetical protein